MRIPARLVNPVLSRELTERMRGPRAMIVMSIYLLLVGGIVLLVYRAQAFDSSPFGSSPVTRLAGTGQQVFEWTLLLTLVLVLFFVPGFTAGSISGERERQTLLPLQVSMLRPLSIVLGKIWASVAFTMLLVVVTMPLLVLAYMIGGVRLSEVVRGVAIVLLTALSTAVLSVACSSLMRRVQTSTVVAYGIVLLAIGGTLGAFLIARQIDASRGADTADPPSLMLSPNPVVALADIVGDDPFERRQEEMMFGYIGPQGPLSGVRDLTVPDVFFEEFGVAMTVPAGPLVADVPGGPQLPGEDGMQLWLQHVIVVGCAMVLLVLFAARRLRTPAKTER